MRKINIFLFLIMLLVSCNNGKEIDPKVQKELLSLKLDILELKGKVMALEEENMNLRSEILKKEITDMGMAIEFRESIGDMNKSIITLANCQAKSIKLIKNNAGK